MTAWWVNHKQTERQERDGQYIWSPQRQRGGKNGKKSHYYDNMRRARIGDPIVSYAGAKISRIGKIAGLATVSRNPFIGAAKEVWGGVGWYVPVRWYELSTSIRPKDFLTELAPLLPTKYSPIRPENGNGNQAAYLCEISEDCWGLVRQKAVKQNFRLSEWLDQAVEEVDPAEAAGDKCEDDEGLDATTRSQVGEARVGQGLFRKRLEAIEERCRVTHVEDPKLLIAGHIKPWRACQTANERLDGHNGFLLAPHVDKLFDRGWISFETDGSIRVSDLIAIEDLERMGLDLDSINVGAILPEQETYLSFHRHHVFVSSDDSGK